jgi:uncharacterized Fe-S cluster-containing protein
MTLDEAIKQCEEAAEDRDKLCKRCDAASGYSRSHNEAIRTQEAKEHEKCSQDFKQLTEWLKELKAYKEQEPCADAISREDAMFLILHYGNEIRHEVMDDIKASMIKLPSVTHARPKGHWIREFDDIEGEVRFICSNCRKHQLFETDFCYHCGSDNRKEEE